MVDRAADFASRPTDSDEERLKKAIFVILAFTGALIITPLWGTLYLFLGEPLAALGPYGFMVVTGIFVLYVLRTESPGPFPYILAGYNLASSVWIHVALGGYNGSSAVMLWAVFTPVGLLLFVGRKEGLRWIPLFIAALAVLALFDSRLAQHADLPEGVITAFYVMNIGAASITLFAVLLYFMIERDRAQERSEQLLLNILPKPIAERLKREPGIIADRFDSVTIVYMDLVGFTALAADLPAETLVGWLNDVHSDLDQLVASYGVEKIKTIGDGYMAAAGVPEAQADHAELAARLALDMKSYIDRCDPLAGYEITCRLGLSSGPVIGGVIGTHKFQYDLWGDTVNTASRMESHAEAGQIQVSVSTYELTKDKFLFRRRGEIDVKGKGTMETFYLVGEREPAEAPV
ncbi:MAG: adenylate/guanylate cyclase domain-containing protein [Acidimicrobiia bacterium]